MAGATPRPHSPGEIRAARAPRPPSWREVFAGKRGRLTAGLLILEALFAIEALMAITILPAIRADLGGLSLYGWALAASSFGAFGAIPLGGRAVDRFGPPASRGAARHVRGRSRARCARAKHADRGGRAVLPGRRGGCALRRLARGDRQDLPRAAPAPRARAPGLDVDPARAVRPASRRGDHDGIWLAVDLRRAHARPARRGLARAPRPAGQQQGGRAAAAAALAVAAHARGRPSSAG